LILIFVNEKRIAGMNTKTFYIETYGCQMNFADSEVVNSILMNQGMAPVQSAEEADVIFVNTCSIRENAESRVWNRLKEFRTLKKNRARVNSWSFGLHG
jgi:tRNA-2-methylthio-N6-dimethylallyladenosine synthase